MPPKAPVSTPHVTPNAEPADAGGAPDASSVALVPPVAARKPHAVKWHGEEVADPWFWLREKENPEVISYLNAENAYTAAQTKSTQTFADALYAEMLSHIKQTDLGVPDRIGHHFHYSRTVEGKQYPILCRRAAKADKSYDESAPEETILDMNVLGQGKTFFALGGFSMSRDEKQVLYSSDSTGFRQYQLFHKDLGTGQTSSVLAERVTSFAWTADDHTVFYVTEDATTKRSNQLWRLDLHAGKPELVLEEKDELFSLRVGRTHDRSHLVLSSTSTDTWEQRVLPASTPSAAFRVVLPREKGHKYEVEHRAGLLYIRTNKGAKNFKMVTAPVGNPSEAHWMPFIPHDPHALLEDVELFANHAVVYTKAEGLEKLRVIDLKTNATRTIDFPEPVYTARSGQTFEFDTTHLRFHYESMVTPPSVFDYELATGARKLLKQQEVPGGFDPSRYASERAWATARDGTKVPLSLVYPKEFKKDGNGACFLYAYGSYGYGMSASFSAARLPLLDRGMVFVIAHIRGGNEMGEAWHDDGMLMKKKNTFFDFIDSAEWLIANQWTKKERLVIEGGSAGGLLMGAVVNERPDLFHAVHAAVPFVDVMNTMMDASLPLTVGEYLEWGNPNEKPAFDYMRSYSPYDNIKAKAYPSMLVTTSLNDSQVMYWEPAKYVAKLRAEKTDKNPLLLKTNMGAGHGGASGRYDRLKETAFERAWLMEQVGITK
jgi:oligopeptidase B